MKIISKFRIILPLIIAVPSVIIPTLMNYIVNKENYKINYDDVKKISHLLKKNYIIVFLLMKLMIMTLMIMKLMILVELVKKNL